MSFLYHKLQDLWKLISTRLSLQYRTSSSERKEQEQQWQNLMNSGCYYVLVMNFLCCTQDQYHYPFFAIVFLAIIVVPFLMISHRNPTNYGAYCVPVISIINLCTLDILSLTYDTIPPIMFFLMFASLLFFSLLLHAKLWINNVSTTNAIFAPLLNLHIIICVEICFQYIRYELYYHLAASLIITFIHFNNIFNGHLVGFKNDLLFFISSILFINLQNMVHIASSVYFVENNKENVILLTISALYCGIICVFGIAYEFTVLALPKLDKISLPYISCIFFGFGFENILVIFYWFQLYYFETNYKVIFSISYWMLCCLPCILPFALLWYFKTYTTYSTSAYPRGKSLWNPHHKWILHNFIETMYYPFIFNKQTINIIINRIYSIVHCSQCKFNKFNDLFSINDENKITWHKPFDAICLENQRCFAKLYDCNCKTEKQKLIFIDNMLGKLFVKTKCRKYITCIVIVIVLKLISYILPFFEWNEMNRLDEKYNGFGICMMKYMFIYPLLSIYIPLIFIHIYNVCIVSYYEYYFSFIWCISSHSMFVDKANVEKFCNQLDRNRVIWDQMKLKDIASILIRFLQ